LRDDIAGLGALSTNLADSSQVIDLLLAEVRRRREASEGTINCSVATSPKRPPNLPAVSGAPDPSHPSGAVAVTASLGR
jgi:hypothetical protein